MRAPCRMATDRLPIRARARVEQRKQTVPCTLPPFSVSLIRGTKAFERGAFLVNFKKIKISMIVASCLYIALGLFLVLWPQTAGTALCFIVGGVLLVVGVSRLVSYFSKSAQGLLFHFDLILGALSLLLGFLFLLHPAAVLGAIPVLIGILLISDGVVKVQLALDLKRVGFRQWWINLFLAAACAALAVLAISNPFVGQNVVLILAGFSFLVDGLLDLWSILYVNRKLKLLEQADVAVVAE